MIVKHDALNVRKILLFVGIAIGLTLGLSVSTIGEAHASSTVYVGTGTEINLKVSGTTLNNGGCNIASVDKPKHRAITAGHCGDIGGTFYLGGTMTPIGKMIAKSTIHRVGELDYGVIQLFKNVRLHNIVRVTGVAEPHVGMAVCKYGHGIGNVGQRCGKILSVGSDTFTMDAFAIFFDSGAPIYTPSGKLVGILSGMKSIGGASVASIFTHVVQATGTTPMTS